MEKPRGALRRLSITAILLLSIFVYLLHLILFCLHLFSFDMSEEEGMWEEVSNKRRRSICQESDSESEDGCVNKVGRYGDRGVEPRQDSNPYKTLFVSCTSVNLTKVSPIKISRWLSHYVDELKAIRPVGSSLKIICTAEQANVLCTNWLHLKRNQ